MVDDFNLYIYIYLMEISLIYNISQQIELYAIHGNSQKKNNNQKKFIQIESHQFYLSNVIIDLN